MHGLQDHFTPALIIFTPLLSVWESFLWLPLLKLISVFSCPFILVLIGREILGRNNPLQYLFPVLWLFDRHIRYLAVTEFQPSTLALPVILASFLFALRKNYKSLYSALILLVFFKENMTVVWLSVGVFMIVCCREKLRGIQLLCLAPLVTAVIMLLVVPHFFGSYAHVSRAGPFAMIQQKMLVLLELLKFVCFIPLFSWRAMLFLLPSLSLTFMSRDPQMMTFNFHYQDVPLAISYVSAIFGLASASQIRIWNVFSVSRKSQMIFTALLLFAIFNSKLFQKILRFVCLKRNSWHYMMRFSY